MAIAYFQPVTRGEISEMFSREISRDLIGSLRAAGLIAAGPRSPQPRAPYAYVTTPAFLAQFGFESLRDLPDIEKLKDAGLLDRTDGSSQVGADKPRFETAGRDDQFDREPLNNKDPERDAA
jgi:segregation and condensation protein B